MARTRRTAAALGAAAVLLCGCSSAVEVSVPGGAAGCGDPRWPATVGGQERRDTDPAGGAVAAWGDPAIVARCGVGALAPTETECIEVDGVGWIPSELTDGTRFTTFGTDPALEVLVPSAYDPAPLLLPAFDEVAQALPRNDLRCR
ncbi:DUF3515 family protein [Arthrobacter sp. NEB 688]|uniref:DUF3515 family protein n=1 Tax=Arthrobacter sp. NEB 688 TaxID=904039 RepID=UPI0015672AF3|nr:DUF3515 family protein [Arthrobacter sp. NEB 688]QKE84220.1 DUF3515 family protein [Arthrobacter sp. NEB 688]